jgi:hypothetical protein
MNLIGEDHDNSVKYKKAQTTTDCDTVTKSPMEGAPLLINNQFVNARAVGRLRGGE